MEGLVRRLADDRYALVVTASMATAVLLLLLSGLLAEGEATAHVRYHSLIALTLVLVAGWVVLGRSRATVASRAPVVGLLLIALGQLVEGTGAFGYAADDDTRRYGIVVLHDAGIGVTFLALVALALALAIAAAAFARARFGRGVTWPALAAAVVGALGLFLLQTLVGF